jgi:GNAT superfamily N-acetyltransferase
VADVSVRPARPEDAERVARVQLATWRQAYADLLPPEALDVPEVQAAAVWLHAIETPTSGRHRLLVALEGHEVVGFMASTPAGDEDLDGATTAEVTALLVVPRWGRRGHGSRLMAAGVDDWRRQGADRAVLWAWEDDPATASFLGSHGWEPDGLARVLDTGPRLQRQVRMHVSLQQ